MTNRKSLFEPIRVGALELPNRILMAPLTRNRAKDDGTPWSVSQAYYAQRASAGLIISEATQIGPMGKGYINTPGIHSDDQAAAWKKITDAVHAAGGRIFLQFWHVGRISHVSLLPEGASPFAPSAIRAESQTFTASGFEDTSEPVAMTAEDIDDVLDEYRHAARMAQDAGFDGVEVHSANGYLLDQFLQDRSNRREDVYGGSIENRMRLLGEVVNAVAEIWPRDRIGVRLSPLGQANDMGDSDPEGLFSQVYEMLDGMGLAYLHVMEQFPGSDSGDEGRALLQRLREKWTGTYIANGGYDARSAADVVTAGHAHAVAFGRPFIANPDLPERYRRDAPLNAPDGDTFYGGDEKGYVDYPFLERSVAPV